jgi:hypothetical protein
MTDQPRGELPGLVEVPWRRFLYISDQQPETFQQRFDELGEYIGTATALPASGGMITENVTITTPNGDIFCGLSFKGDLGGWERGILAFAEHRGIKTLRIRDPHVVVNDGTAWPLEACRVGTYDVTRSQRTRR